ncbi:MAG: DUF2061 domain-containing protein [Nitrospira sp.]|nr:DUF2061 domain-containing protein [Candidatus Manganitrophaceae bacterium]HIL33793.1 DUF2061 domain-containing protein [Candidatus Manganitrophaceae bacterium]
MNKQSRETHLRSILKGLSWRFVATGTTIVIAYIITGDPSIALEIGAIEVFAKLLFYYLHERIWQFLPRGTIRQIETKVIHEKRKKPRKGRKGQNDKNIDIESNP